MKERKYVSEILKWTILSFFAILFFVGCRKYDSSLPYPIQKYDELKTSFFNTNATADIEIKKLAADVRKQDSIFKFLPEFVKKNGIPKWDKTLYKVIGRNENISLRNSSSTSTVSETGRQGVFIIPLLSTSSNEVKSYITAYKHNDSTYTYRLYNRDSLNALQPGSNQAKFNLLNTQAVFGYFEKQLNNNDTISIKAPVNGRIKNAKLRFSEPNDRNKSKSSEISSKQTSSSCYIDITIVISYEWRDFTYCYESCGEWVAATEVVSVSVLCIDDGSGNGGGYSGSGYNWWNWGTGWPYDTGSGGYYDPNWNWWWSSGGTGGNGNVFSQIVTVLSNQLGLSFSESIWLENNPVRASEIYNYFQITTNPRANNIVSEHIDKMISDPDYFAFNQQYYSTTGSSNVWWEDDSWLDNPNNFNIDLEQDQNGQYDKLTTAEKGLVKQYPTHAYMISKNKPVAEQETIAIFGQNGLNDKSDAFRHAFFNAMNTRDLGKDPMTLQNIAKLFSDAHESEVPVQLQKEKEMDLWNNAIGHIVGDVMFPIFTSSSSLSSDVLNKLMNGDLRYLKPVEPTPQSGSNGLNNDFWHINGNQQLGRHGITSSTQLTPTNQ